MTTITLNKKGNIYPQTSIITCKKCFLTYYICALQKMCVLEIALVLILVL